MTNFSKAIDIQAPPDCVWAVMSDVERWAEWTASITSIERLDKGPLRKGSRARVRQPKLLPAVFEVTELSQGKSFKWVTRSAGVTAIATHSVEPRNGGSRATLSVEFSGWLAGIAGRLFRGLNERYLTMEANGLKQRSESRERQSA